MKYDDDGKGKEDKKNEHVFRILQIVSKHFALFVYIL